MPQIIHPWLAPKTISALRPTEAPAGKNIAILAPHPDDELLGCAGTLAAARAKDASTTLHVLYLTDGERGSSDPAKSPADVARIRRQEARNGLAVLGFAEGENASFSDGGLCSEPQTIQRVSQFLRRHQPDIVMVPVPLDPHPDHRAATNILADAFLSDRGLQPAVWLYEIEPCFPMNSLIRIDPFEAAKTAALREHGSQGIERLTRAACGLAACRALYAPTGWQFAEAFRIGSTSNFLALCRSLGMC